MVRYRNAKTNFKKLTEKLGSLIIGNKESEARLLCEESKGFIAALFKLAIQELPQASDLNNPVEDELNRIRRIFDEELQTSIIPYLEKHLNALDTLARGTPLLGLLGTVEA